MGKIQFKYHPNIYEDDVLVHKSGICQCCGKQISEYIEHIYSAEDVDCICLQCVSDGTAAQKFDAEFVSWAEPVSDPEKSDELFHRTPGYLGWQDENWLACCDDYRMKTVIKILYTLSNQCFTWCTCNMNYRVSV